MIIPGRKAERRNRHQLVIDADLYSICRQDTRRIPCKCPSLQSAVVADRDRLRTALRLHPVGHALRRLPDNPDVHTICSGAKRPAQSGGSELKRNRKPLFDGCVIALNILEFLLQVKIDQIGTKPLLIFILIHRHRRILPLFHIHVMICPAEASPALPFA